MVSNIFDAALNTATPWESFLFVVTLILCLYPILGGQCSGFLVRYHTCFFVIVKNFFLMWN